MEEIFKQAWYINPDGSIEIYENYEVSNLGRVKSLGNSKMRKEKILNPGVYDKQGHMMVILRKNNKSYMRTVHRLVLSTFNAEMYFKKAVVDHIDSNPRNNKLDNLRWLTQKENASTEHAIQAYKDRKLSEESKRKISEANKGSNNSRSQTCEYDGKTFGCIKDAYEYAKANGYTKTYCTFKNMIKKRN